MLRVRASKAECSASIPQVIDPSAADGVLLSTNLELWSL
jgi:hypothetical protein